jgi:NAD+-dependent protein deacetylase SIR2
MGTSLQVHPFASLTQLVPSSCPRVLINLERAGDIGRRPDDVLCLGKCDDIIKELAKELGWKKELKKAWAETIFSVEGTGLGDGEEETESDESTEVEETEEERLNREIEQITKSVDETLRVADTLKQNVERDGAHTTETPHTPTEQNSVKL